MLKNYIKSAWRNLTRNKFLALINVGGLAIGMAVALLIGLWIHDELSFNHYHLDYTRIGQVMTKGNDAEHGPFTNSSLQYPLATALRTTYRSNFSQVVRASWVQDYVLSAGERKLSRTGQFMDAEAPDMLSLKMLEGSHAALQSPYSILLSAATAKALFGNEPALNKLIKLNNKTSLSVTGVYEDLPLNSQFHDIRFFSTWEVWVKENAWIEDRAINDWHNHFLKLFVKIPAGASFASVDAAIKDVELQHISKLEGFADHVARHPQVFVHPMAKWHLQPYTRQGVTDVKPLRLLWTIGIIGMFVLLLACINFMNLSTARSEKRSKEVGIRKTIGSRRIQLIAQFFGESFMVATLAFALSCLLVSLTLPWFNQLAGKEMYIPWSNVLFWLMSLGCIFITGLLAGSYPALYLSSFRPISVLKGSFRVGRLALLPRKILVVAQFTVSVALIICTIVVNRQLQLGKDRPIGYDTNGLIMMGMNSPDFEGKSELLNTELKGTGLVAAFSQSMGKITEVASGNNGFEWKGKDARLDESFGTLAVTPDHGRTVGWQFIAGHDFVNDKSDSNAVVINESAAKYMGLREPVGETITWKWKDNEPVPFKILGVIKDMVMESPYDPVEPTLFFVKALNGGVSWINIKVKPGVSMSRALPVIEAVFRKLVPAVPFEFQFVDEAYAAKFAAEERAGKLAGVFTFLAVFISCLGLFGVAAFVAEQRTKEIGVRKVLGASSFRLWRLLTQEFVLLGLIAFVIASPLAYYFMQGWLANYQIRTNLSWSIFALAALAILLITVLTVSMQAIKATMANPVKSLRAE